MNEPEAIAELTCLSDNAKRWIEDRIGNKLGIMTEYASLGMPHKVHTAADELLKDMNRFGCFERQTRRLYSAE